MALIIRLRQQGSKNRQTYRLVVTQKTNPRDGRYIDLLGWYNPLLEEDMKLDIEKIEEWLSKGAEISEKAKVLIKRFSPEILKKLAEKKQQARMNRKIRSKEKATKGHA